MPRSCSWIFQYCAQIDDKATDAGDDVVDALTNNRGTPLARARTMVALCRASRIPARLVTGFRSCKDRCQAARVGRSVRRAGWVPFDPTDGYSLNMPMTYVPVRRGGGCRGVGQRPGDRVPQCAGPTGDRRSRFAVMDRDPSSACRAKCRIRRRYSNLTRLPVPMHTVMKILLLLPFAALITAFMRNVIGLGTFGTFSPALLAMSFIYADLKPAWRSCDRGYGRPGGPRVLGEAAAADGAAA